jgi:predicted outer membrane lipoprotein
VKKQAEEVKGQVLQTIATLLTTAFGLIAALAWNEAIKALILELVPKQDGLTGLFIYAIIITVIAVVATILIGRAIAKPAVQEVRIVE